MASGTANIPLWLLFVSIFALCAFWHKRENAQVSAQLHEQMDANAARHMTQLFRGRSWQLLTALGCGMLIIAFYDWQLSAARTTPNMAQDQSQKQAVSTSPAPNTALAATNRDFPAVLSTLKAQIEEAQKPLPAPPADTLDDVYNPQKTGTDNQSAMDDIKRRYEDVLVNYIFLEKCGKTTPNDYRIIMSALGQEMASVNAPGRLQYDILTAAQGSYKELYAASRCEGAGFDALNAQYSAYIKTLSEHFPAQ